MARQHLADQAERQELDADDDEQHPEQQQRPVADGGSADLVCGEVGEDGDGLATEAITPSPPNK